MSASPPPDDPYAALGVGKDATVEAIKSSYRKMVLRAHPDKVPATATAEEKQKKADEFHKIQKAYETIGDPVERLKHDAKARSLEREAELKRDIELMRERKRDREMREKEARDRERESASTRRTARSQPGSGDYSNLRTYPSGTHDSRSDYPAPGSYTVPMRDYRFDAVYEERVPQRRERRYEEDYGLDDVRFSTGSKNDSVKSTSKRASARDAFPPTDETRRTEEYEEKMKSKANRQAQKKEKMKTHEAERKQRDKYRRQDRENATSDRTPKLGATSDDSESDDYSTKYSRRRSEAQAGRRTEESGRRSRREGRSTRASVESDYSEDDRLQSLYREQEKAREMEMLNYIKRQNKGSSDPEESARSSRRRERTAPPPAAPDAPPAPHSSAKEQSDKAKRSSATKKSTKESRETRDSRPSPPREKTRRIEIVDAGEPTRSSRRGATDPTRIRPGLDNTQSAPPDLLERMVNHSKTWPAKATEKESIPVRRAKTGGLEPVQTRNQDRESERDRDRDRDRSPFITPRSSRRAEMSSASTDEYAERDYGTPTGSSLRYRVMPETKGDSSNTSPYIVPIEPSGRHSSRTRRSAESREVSPRGPRSSGQSRPAPFGLGIGGIQRASTFQEGKSARERERDRLSVEPESPRFSGPARASTMRNSSVSGDTFFGEVPPGGDPRNSVPFRPSTQRSGTGSSSYSKDQIYWAPELTKKNIIFSEHRADMGRARQNSDSEPRSTRERSPLSRDDHKDSTGGSNGSRRREGPMRSSSDVHITRNGVNRHTPSGLRPSVASRG